MVKGLPNKCRFSKEIRNDIFQLIHILKTIPGKDLKIWIHAQNNILFQEIPKIKKNPQRKP